MTSLLAIPGLSLEWHSGTGWVGSGIFGQWLHTGETASGIQGQFHSKRNHSIVFRVQSPVAAGLGRIFNKGIDNNVFYMKYLLYEVFYSLESYKLFKSTVF